MIKIKIRPTDSDEELLQVAESLIKTNGLKIRLDGNQSFTSLELTNFLNNFKKKLGQQKFSEIDYIEEPLIDNNDYKPIYDEFKIPLAVDESMTIDNVEKFLELSFVKAIVLKPSLFGISSSLKIITTAQTKYLKDCVISSTYEAGSAFLGHLFLAQKLPLTYHGLDTLHLLPPNLSVLDGYVTFSY